MRIFFLNDRYQRQTLATLQFALTRDFKYLITSDDDFELMMNKIMKINDSWFHLGELDFLPQ